MENMLPCKVKIAGIEYQVKEVEGNLEKFNNLGQINYYKGIIEIDKSLADDRKEQVLVHEILHGIFFEAGFEDHEEDMINRLSIVLHQVLKDNDFNFDNKLFIQSDDGAVFKAISNTY